MKEASKGKITDKTIGAKIWYYRETASLSQITLARILGYKGTTAISLIETGQRGFMQKP